MLKKMRKFLENTSGSLLPTMGILIIPLGIAAGAAVDYTRYVNMRNEVQIGIDTAAIATINELPDILSSIPQNLEGDAFDARANIELRKYAEGFLEANILCNSSTTRSLEIILIRFLFFVMAFSDVSSIVKSNCVAKRIARIIRKGSCEYVISGFKGVRIVFLSKSFTPLKGSSRSP